MSWGRVRRHGGPVRGVLRRRRDGSGRQLYAEFGGAGFAKQEGGDCLAPPRFSLSKGHHAGLRHQFGKLHPIDERGVQALQVLLGHPTGNGARPSDIHRHFPLDHLLDQLR
jgi:hypothetical protein